MKIILSGSLDFTKEITEIAEKLERMGHCVTIPKTSEDIINKNVSFDTIMEEKSSGKIVERGIKIDAIRKYFHKIKESDALLVLNFDKKSVKNYIGGATLIEMGFAHALNKRLLLLNGIPDMHYTDEIRIMEPEVLEGRLDKLAGKE